MITTVQLVFTFCAVVRCLCPPSSHRGGCRLSGIELQPHRPWMPGLTEKGNVFLQRCGSGECVAALGQEWGGCLAGKLSGLWSMNSLKPHHGCPNHWWILCLLPLAISSLHRMPSKTTRYSMEIVSPATQRWLFLGKSSRTVAHSCRDLRRPAHYSSPFTGEGVCTPRVHLLWLFSLWDEGEGGEIICLVYISLW